MNYPGFCWGSNRSQSVIADGERTMNFYYEQIESPSAPTPGALYPCPGFASFLTVPQVGCRALFSMNDRCFGIVGVKLYEFFATQTYTERGTVAAGMYPATISGNGPIGNQLGITAGNNWYNYDLGTNTLTQVAALTGKATQGGMKDGYFLCFDVTTGTVYVSNLDDGTTWNTVTMYFQRSIAPDPWRAMVVGNPYIYMLGEQTSEAWFDAGTSPQPFAPILSSFMQYGCPAPFAAGMAGESLLFLSRSAGGQGVVIGTQGYAAIPISTYAVETAIQAMARGSSIADAELLTYQDQGHTFGNFSFPSGEATWSVDVDGGGLWHERGKWNTVTNQYDVWQPRVHCYAFGQHLVGDRSTGQISSMDVTNGSEADGGMLRRLRIGPPLWAASRQRMQISRFSLRVEPGLGLTSGQGVNPLVLFNYSTDGKTWSNVRQASAGRLGRYGTRVFFTRCGSSRQLWQPQIVTTDPTIWRFSGAEIEGNGFQQRQAA